MQVIESWRSLIHTAVAATAAYVFLVAFLRLSGKRTLAKLNAFDLVVTVALGSTLASIATSDRLPLANGLLALALLILLQYAVAWANLRADWFQRLVKSEPTLLVYRGAFLSDAMRRSRVARDEVLSAVRSAGVLRLTEVGAVVLEPDGTLSVVTGSEPETEPTSLRDVPGAKPTGSAGGGDQRC